MQSIFNHTSPPNVALIASLRINGVFTCSARRVLCDVLREQQKRRLLPITDIFSRRLWVDQPIKKARGRGEKRKEERRKKGGLGQAFFDVDVGFFVYRFHWGLPGHFMRLAVSTVPSPPVCTRVGPPPRLSAVDIGWGPPASDGGEPVLKYDVEMRVVKRCGERCRAREMSGRMAGWASCHSKLAVRVNGLCFFLDDPAHPMTHTPPPVTHLSTP